MSEETGYSPRLRLLRERVARWGDALEADGRAIEQLKAELEPGGFWVLGGGSAWKFRRSGRKQPRRAS